MSVKSGQYRCPRCRLLFPTTVGATFQVCVPCMAQFCEVRDALVEFVRKWRLAR